jgi:hypothetical protein
MILFLSFKKRTCTFMGVINLTKEEQMRFYTNQHKYYCGIDLHAKNLYVCIVDQQSQIIVHKNIPAHPDYVWSARLLAMVAGLD